MKYRLLILFTCLLGGASISEPVWAEEKSKEQEVQLFLEMDEVLQRSYVLGMQSMLRFVGEINGDTQDTYCLSEFSSDQQFRILHNQLERKPEAWALGLAPIFSTSLLKACSEHHVQ